MVHSGSGDRYWDHTCPKAPWLDGLKGMVHDGAHRGPKKGEEVSKNGVEVENSVGFKTRDNTKTYHVYIFNKI